MASTDSPTTRRRHVVVFDFPFGHTSATHALTRHLASSTPDVLFSFLSTAKSNATVASIPAPPNLTLHALSDIVPGETPSTDFREKPNLFLKAAPGSFVEGVERAVREGGGAKVSCILADCYLAKFARKMAEEMGVPWMVLRTGSACDVSIYVNRNIIRSHVGVGVGDVQGDEEHKLDIIPSLSHIDARDLPEGYIPEHVDNPMLALLREMGRELPSAAAVAVNTFQALEGDIISDLNTKLRKTLPVGPLHLTSLTPPTPDPHGCLPWLDRQPPASVVYVSFGIVACPTDVELANLAVGLEASGISFLWSLNERFAVNLPVGFQDRIVGRGMVVPWVPQTDVLNHTSTAAFVTHCGWKSVMESITAGVPMICRPICFDQKMNAKQVVNKWKVGISIEGQCMSKESVVDALKSVVGSGDINMRKAVGLLKQLAMEAVGPSGSSTKSFQIMKDIICA